MSATRSKKTIAGTLAAVALSGAAMATLPGLTHPAKADIGPGDVIGAASTIWSQTSLCMENLDNGLPCTQSTAASVSQIHNMMSTFIKQYEKDRVRTMKSFDVVVANQKDAAVRQSWESVRADLETSHVGMNIYNSFLDCVDVAAHADPNKPATCSKVNRFGVKVGTQEATPQAIMAGRDMLIANETRDNTTGVGGYALSPTDLMQRLGGGTMNPYENRSVLGAIVDRDRAAEVARQGDAVGSKLFFAPASYVNEVGNTVTNIADSEQAYFAVRVVAASMRDDKGFASDLQDLAANGRDDSSPILSIDSQRKTFTFPDWTPDHQLAANQAILATSEGPVLTQNLGTSNEPTTKAPLPSPQLMETISRDMANNGGYAKYVQKYPEAMPAVDKIGQLTVPRTDGSRNLESQRVDDTVARWWSSPITVFGGTIQPRSAYGFTLPHDASMKDESPFHVFSQNPIPKVENSQQERSVPIEMYKNDSYLNNVRNYMNGDPYPRRLRLGGQEYWMTRVTNSFSMPTADLFPIYDGEAWARSQYNNTYGYGNWIKFNGVSAANVSVEPLAAEGLASAQ